MMVLGEFIDDMIDKANKFRIYWINQNLKDPENWPLELQDDNDGLWWELFFDFITRSDTDEMSKR